MPTAKVHGISAAAPDDVRGIEDAIIGGRIDPDGIVAIFGKTEGNGCVNDFTRGYATQSLGLMLHRFVPRERAGYRPHRRRGAIKCSVVRQMPILPVGAMSLRSGCAMIADPVR